MTHSFPQLRASASLWECTPHLGRPRAEIGALADGVYLSVYKSLGGLSGAVLAGKADFIEQARLWRHRYGGLQFQQFPAAVAAMAGLAGELPRLPAYVAKAAEVADALHRVLAAQGSGARVHPHPPPTRTAEPRIGHGWCSTRSSRRAPYN